MLKSIIKQENIDWLFELKRAAGTKTVFPNAKEDSISESVLQKFDFVTCPVRASIASAQNRDPFPFRKKLFCKPKHHRRLAGAAHGQIADAYNRRIQSLLLHPAFFIHPDARAHCRSVQQRKR